VALKRSRDKGDDPARQCSWLPQSGENPGKVPMRCALLL
jgi:hypothetical protein